MGAGVEAFARRACEPLAVARGRVFDIARHVLCRQCLASYVPAGEDEVKALAIDFVGPTGVADGDHFRNDRARNNPAFLRWNPDGDRIRRIRPCS
jgi:hypothetical protein